MTYSFIFMLSHLVEFATQPATWPSLYHALPAFLSTFSAIFYLFTLLSNSFRQILSFHTLQFSTFYQSFLFKLLRTLGMPLVVIALRKGALLAYIAQPMIQTAKVADTKAQLPKSQ